MAQDSGSAANQSIGNPGPCIFQYPDPSGNGIVTSVSFHPAYVQHVSRMYSPFQKVNLAVNGAMHVFQLANGEQFEIVLEVHDLPMFDAANPVEPTQGLQSLLSFIRYTINYHAKEFTLITPDGLVEQVRYVNGCDSLKEAEFGNTNISKKAQRWAGQFVFLRAQPA